MADEYILKSFDGGAQKTSLTSAFTIGGTTLAVSNGSTFPDGSSGPFVVVVDRGLATEEKYLIDTTTGVNGTTFNIQQAGYDGTSASAHSVGAVVEHCLDAYTVEQANRYVNLQTAKGDLVLHNGTTTAKLAVGANNTVFIADSSVSAGAKWATIGTSSLTDASVTAGKLATDSVETSKIVNLNVTTGKIADAAVTDVKLASNAVTTVKINDAAVTAAKLAAGVGIPTGVVSSYAGSSAPTGYLICDGAAYSRTDPLYAALYAVIGTTYGSGNGTTTFNIPDLRTRVPVGYSMSDTDTDPTATNNALNSLGKTGGSKTHLLITSEMPQHSHTIAHTHIYEIRGSVGTFANNATDLYMQGGSAVSSTYGSSRVPISQDTSSSGNAGSNAAHNILQPYIVLNYIIKL